MISFKKSTQVLLFFRKEFLTSKFEDYIVEMKEKFAPNWKEVKTVPASQTNAHIEGLHEGDDYIFRIIAKNKGDFFFTN